MYGWYPSLEIPYQSEISSQKNVSGAAIRKRVACTFWIDRVRPGLAPSTMQSVVIVALKCTLP